MARRWVYARRLNALTLTSMAKESKAHFKMLGARAPEEECIAARKDARRLGLTISQWLRIALIRALATPITKKDAEAYLDDPKLAGKT